MQTSSLVTWIEGNIITLILIISVAIVLWAGKNGNISRVVTIVGCGVVGLVWLSLATTGAGERVGTWLVGLLGV